MRSFLPACLGLVAAAFIALQLPGCSGYDSLDELDNELSGLIERERDLTLGTDASRGEPIDTIGQGRATQTPTQYDREPQSTNPTTNQLTTQPSGRQMRTGDALIYAEVASPLDPDNEYATRLDLEGLLAFAIANAPEYRRQKEVIFLQTLDLIIERHQWGPRFFNTTTARLQGDIPEAGDHEQALNLINDFTVSRRLPYGGDISATALVDYTNLLRKSSASTGSFGSQGTTLSLDLDLPLLRGAGKVAQESRIQAERDLIYAVRDFERFRREFLVDLSRSYFDLIAQQEQIENVRRQLISNERLAARFASLAEAGREAVFQAEDAQQTVLSNRNSLLNVEERYATAIDLLKLRLGMPITDPLILVPAEVLVPEPVLNVTQSVNTAMDNRLDLQTRRDRVDDTRRAVKVAENNMKADLDLDASLDLRTRSDRDFGGVNFDLGRGDYALGMTLGAPIDRRIEQAELRRSRVRLEQNERDFRVERDRVVLQVRDSIRGIDQARYTLELQTRGVQLNERRLEGVRLRERTLGPRDVIDAEEDLLEARNARDQAAANLRIRVLDYLLNTGQMRVAADGSWMPPGKLVPIDDATQTQPQPESGG
ncbi:TolC family protein [Mucisphaera calidilacus]|uniref:Outer membrane efflux protein n=1 Tax=Mucisphaera calidilacus TaxID=2527982 RepID=A0A518BYA4_9BACT|nr:TolC family protein [Mucisphaera calidilacus]QDU71959.1 Outer membrane efflux protein [Mucisphaera calidilacus]